MKLVIIPTLLNLTGIYAYNFDSLFRRFTLFIYSFTIKINVLFQDKQFVGKEEQDEH